MFIYELDWFFIVMCVFCCYYIFVVVFDWVWVSYGKNIFLINIDGGIFNYVKNLCGELYSGLYIINFDDE